MDVALTDEQQHLADCARRFVRRESPPSVVRRLEMAPDGFSAELWNGMRALGWPGLAHSVTDGGEGGGVAALSLVAEELGAGAAICPLLPSVVSGLALTGVEGPTARRWLADLVSGEAIGATALWEPDGSSFWPEAGAPRAAEGWTLSGEKVLVPFATAADVLLVTTRLHGLGQALVALSRPSRPTAFRRHASLSADPLYRIDLAGTTVTADDVVAHGMDAVHRAEMAGHIGWLTACACAVGLCQAALDLSVDHARHRKQFGRPIGAFQSVANRCADMRTTVDAARWLVRRAAWRVDHDHPDAGIDAAVARITAVSMIRTVVSHAHQVVGAMGFSTEHDLHLFTRRAKAIQVALPVPRSDLDLVATAIGL